MKGSTYHAKINLDFFNRRLKLEEYRGNLPLIIEEMYKLVDNHQLEKLICKVRHEDLFVFIENGFMIEAVIKRYFVGSDCYFVTKYFSNERRNSDKWMEEETILSGVLAKKREEYSPDSDPKFHIRKATPKDATELASLYSQVFQIYPTPLNKPNYIEKVMNDTTIFYVVEDNGQIVSAASAEVNGPQFNAELTDCATLPSYRKHGLMKQLLVRLEEELVRNDIFCAYSIARALSYGMNNCFYQLGYSYTGRLTNNCYIFDKIEDMNVWVRDLSQ
ncbi:putative beta-lysine N-acetyltransferase [Fredinandcohnia sp. 179-A 10B2 NHS]|uniref:putative beta-lysine N-acetyltransferase n=1 Tax=Fredinandcohnia sp. 179-A 10B2 NHS TaxID=3235176 RepID=UPI0039A2A055